jgi:hypothetical protein
MALRPTHWEKHWELLKCWDSTEHMTGAGRTLGDTWSITGRRTRNFTQETHLVPSLAHTGCRGLGDGAPAGELLLGLRWYTGATTRRRAGSSVGIELGPLQGEALGESGMHSALRWELRTSAQRYWDTGHTRDAVEQREIHSVLHWAKSGGEPLGDALRPPGAVPGPALGAHWGRYWDRRWVTRSTTRIRAGQLVGDELGLLRGSAGTGRCIGG